jgi:hypothetical protein
LGRDCSASPDQHFTVLIDGEPFRIDDFSFQIVEVRVIEIESALEGTVRQPLLTLQQLKDLGQEFIKRHHGSFTGAWDRVRALSERAERPAWTVV